MKTLTAVKTIMKVCSDNQKNNKNCVGCVFYRATRNMGGLGCLVQTDPGDYDVALIAKNIQGEQL